MKVGVFNEDREADTALTGLQFLRWLEERESRSVVGIPGAAGDCPLATYLRSLGFNDPRVSGRQYQADGKSGNGPAWMDGFVLRVDAQGRSPITREQAIEYLLETIVGSFSVRGSNITSYSALAEVLREMVGNAFKVCDGGNE